MNDFSLVYVLSNTSPFSIICWAKISYMFSNEALLKMFPKVIEQTLKNMLKGLNYYILLMDYFARYRNDKNLNDTFLPIY